jgi:hypothetical protein
MSADVPRVPGEVLDEETGLHQQTARECVDPIIAARIQAAHEDAKVLEQADWLPVRAAFSRRRRPRR